jgi:hypothetical protein
MIDQRNLDRIVNFLGLEKIIVLQKIEIICFPNMNLETPDFNEKIEKVKKELKKLGSDIELKIVEEGEIDNNDVKYIEFSPQSGSDGINPFGR